MSSAEHEPHRELVPATHIPPLDCTGDCGYGPCNCSGEWRVRAYTKESVDSLLEQFGTLRSALEEILERPHGELDEHDMRSIAHAALDRASSPAKRPKEEA